MVLLDYWVPCQLRWLRRDTGRGNRRVVDAGAAEACRQVASRSPVSQDTLSLAQEFASAIWFRVAMVSVALFMVVALSSLAFPVGHSRNVVLEMAGGCGSLFPISAAEATMVAWRGSWTARHNLRTRRGQYVEPWSARLGKPRRRDFWVVLILVGAGTGWIVHGLLALRAVR